ncbi:MAG: zinc-finger domain-containing protein [Pseudomonadota bacterium]
MSDAEKIKAETNTSEQTVFYIQPDQLPLHCPLPEMSLWNQHPRVFLPIEDSGSEKCPYCGCEFILEDN